MNQQLHDDILEWVRTLKFKRKLIGGVDYEDVLRKMEELTNLYETLLLSEKASSNSPETDLKGGGGKHG